MLIKRGLCCLKSFNIRECFNRANINYQSKSLHEITAMSYSKITFLDPWMIRQPIGLGYHATQGTQHRRFSIIKILDIYFPIQSEIIPDNNNTIPRQ